MSITPAGTDVTSRASSAVPEVTVRGVPLRVAFLNVEGLRDSTAARNHGHYHAKFQMLSEFLLIHKIDVLGMTETHARDDDIFPDIDGYQMYPPGCGKPRKLPGRKTSTSGGVAFLIKSSSIPHDRVQVGDDDGDHGSLWVSILDEAQQPIHIGCTYSEDKTSARRLKLTMDELWQLRMTALHTRIDSCCPVIYGGDFNCHVPALHGQKRDPYAARLCEILRSLDVSLLNLRHKARTCFPTRSEACGGAATGKCSSTCIDLVIVSNGIVNRSSLSVPELSHPMSRHRSVQLTVNILRPIVSDADMPAPAPPVSRVRLSSLACPKNAGLTTDALELVAQPWLLSHSETLLNDPAQTALQRAYDELEASIQTAVADVLGVTFPDCKRPEDAPHLVHAKKMEMQIAKLKKELNRRPRLQVRDRIQERVCTISLQRAQYLAAHARIDFKDKQRRLQEAVNTRDSARLHSALDDLRFNKKKGARLQLPVNSVNDSGAPSLATSSEEIADAHKRHWETVMAAIKDADMTDTVRKNELLLLQLRKSKGQILRDATPDSAPSPGHRQHAQYSALIKHLNRDIDVKEIRDALQDCRKDSCPGDDGISYRVLGTFGAGMLECLKVLFTGCFDTSTLPSQWLVATVRPMFKGDMVMDRGKTTDVTKYRGITLLSCVSKLLEKVLLSRMEAYVSVQSPWHPNQHGFRSDHTSASHIYTVMESFRLRGFNCPGVAIDTQRAFPQLSHGSIADSLYHKKAISGKALGLALAFLCGNIVLLVTGVVRQASGNGDFVSEGRTCRIAIGGVKSAPYTITRGAPEGMVNSSFYYGCFCDQFLHAVHDSGHGYYHPSPSEQCDGFQGIVCFADDIFIIPRNFEDLQAIMNVIGDIAHESMQTFSAEKTELVIFRQNKDLPSYPTAEQLKITVRGLSGARDGEGVIKHRNTDGTLLQQVKYLGLILHQTLSWSAHLQQVTIPKVTRRINRLRRDVANHDVLSPNMCMQVIDIDVFSCFRYGVEIWGVPLWLRGTCSYSSDLDELDGLFTTTLHEILGLTGERALDSAVHKELGWAGVDGVYIASLLQFLHSALRMDSHRLPHHYLVRSLDAVQLANGTPVLPQTGGSGIILSAVAACCASVYHQCFGPGAMRDLLRFKQPYSRHCTKKYLIGPAKEVAAESVQGSLFMDRPMHHAAANYSNTTGSTMMMADLFDMPVNHGGKVMSALIVARWRVGSAAIGSTVDRFHPPWGEHIPFCVWCQCSETERASKVPDTVAHTLLACDAVQNISIRQQHLPRLVNLMEGHAPQWHAQFTVASPDVKCTLILNACQAVPDAGVRKLVGRIVTSWIASIAQSHPIHSERLRGVDWDDLQYLPTKPKDTRPKGISNYHGVTRLNNSVKWQARIKTNKVRKHLGYFATRAEAAAAYDAALVDTGDERRIKRTRNFSDFQEAATAIAQEQAQLDSIWDQHLHGQAICKGCGANDRVHQAWLVATGFCAKCSARQEPSSQATAITHVHYRPQLNEFVTCATPGSGVPAVSGNDGHHCNTCAAAVAAADTFCRVCRHQRIRPAASPRQLPPPFAGITSPALTPTAARSHTIRRLKPSTIAAPKHVPTLPRCCADVGLGRQVATSKRSRDLCRCMR
jgi:hypothetical protein